MSWHLFDERGERAYKILLCGSGAVRGHTTDTYKLSEGTLVNAWGFAPLRWWRPTWIACKMTKGYRVYMPPFPDLVEYIEDWYLHNWWQPAAPDHKRLPSMTAVEMWIRHKAMAHG